MIILREIQRHYWLSWHGVCVCVVAGAPDSASIYVKTSSETQDTPFWPEYCENLQQCHRHKWDPSMLCTIACRAMAVITCGRNALDSTNRCVEHGPRVLHVLSTMQ